MGVTPSIPETALHPGWVDKFVQPDFHGRLRSRQFLNTLKRSHSSVTGDDDTTFRWSYAGLTFCLTSEEVESLITKVRDYQLGITVSDEDNSISGKATKMQRCRESLAVATTATPSFQRDFEYRLAILRSLQGPLRRARDREPPL